MEMFSKAVVTEQYCPAKKAFVQQASITEFVKRSSAHCKDDPPTGSGLSGAQVTLDRQCSEVYATACP